MQDDDKHKTDNDVIEDEDFDLSDFDDDLADDDSWDEFDDSDSSESAVGNDKSDKTSATVKKSFLQKNFNLIAIASVVLVGGGFFLSQMGSSPTSEQTAVVEPSQLNSTEIHSDAPAVENVTALSSDTSLPPMPTPVDAEGSKMDVMDDLDSLETALTPMPKADNSDDMISEFSIDEVQAVPVSDKMLKTADNGNMEADPAMMEFSAEKTIDLKPVQSMDKSDALMKDLPTETQELASPLNDLLEMDADGIMSSAAANQNQGLDDKTANENSMLSKKIVETNNKLDELVNSISALEKRLDKLAAMQSLKPSQMHKTAVMVAKSMSSPKSPTRKPVKNQMVKPNLKVNTPKMKMAPVTSTKWKLRSAQPGKALVAPVGSNDLITVHIGDTLPGIGRISDIVIENNKWVIRGTQGLISQ